MPRYKIYQHRRNVHNIRQPKEVVIPRTSNSKVGNMQNKPKTKSMLKMKSMPKMKSTQKTKSTQKKKSTQKMVHLRQAKEENNSMSVQEHFPVKVEECEENGEGDSTQVMIKGELKKVTSNSNNSYLEEGTNNEMDC